MIPAGVRLLGNQRNIVKDRRMAAPETFYNANCPVCSAGVTHIRRLVGTDLAWVDIGTRPDALAAYGATLEAVKKRLHVIDRQGVLRVGVPAFAALWDETPRYRWLARLLRLPVLREVAAAAYELLAIVLYAWNRRRERRQASACQSAVGAIGEDERSS
jgi:predicted DCC family thiol-disulfide oxidoreductase YuxK